MHVEHTVQFSEQDVELLRIGEALRKAHWEIATSDDSLALAQSQTSLRQMLNNTASPISVYDCTYNALARIIYQITDDFDDTIVIMHDYIADGQALADAIKNYYARKDYN